LALGGLQGLVGWWMVKSGLEGRASVAPERLAAHLGLALILLAALVWTALEAVAGAAPAEARARTRWRAPALILAGGVYIQCLLGALVAGSGGGLVDGDWPLMGGRLVPDDYWRGGLWATLAHGPSAAQFDHRLFAYALLAFAAWFLVAALRRGPDDRRFRGFARGTVAHLVLQAGLGIAALRVGDPLWLALAHQANAALTLGMATALVWRSRRLVL
jgi:cytochrome c oxidase assembly protein subunit 15